MAERLERKLAVLAKIESTYGTDATPTGGANAMLMSDVKITPIKGTELRRENLLPYLGNQGAVFTGKHMMLEGKVEMAGSGAAGTPPAFGPLIRAAGFAEVINAGVDVKYQPVSGSFESLSLHFYLDGVRHIGLGSRIDLDVDAASQKYGFFNVKFVGLIGPYADVTNPAVTLSAFQDPLEVGFDNSSFTLHGAACIMEKLSLSIGNDLQPRLLVGAKKIAMTDRDMRGNVTIEASSLAVKDWFGIANNHTKAAMNFSHGIGQPGKIIQIDAARTQIGLPEYGSTQKIVNHTLPLMFLPGTSGNDELIFTFK